MPAAPMMRKAGIESWRTSISTGLSSSSPSRSWWRSFSRVRRNCSWASLSAAGGAVGPGPASPNPTGEGPPGGGSRRFRSRSSVAPRARCRTCSERSARTISTARSARSRTIDSTSRPTYPTSVYFDASTLMKGEAARRASRRAISVFPTPVGPIMMMFLGATSSAISGDSLRRRVRLRRAIATARLAFSWPMM